MYRRKVLLSLVGVLGGCASTERGPATLESYPTYALKMTTVTPEEISSRHFPTLSEQSHEDGGAEALKEAVNTGSATHTTQVPEVEPENPEQLRYQGTVYKFTSTLIAADGVTKYRYTVALTGVDSDVAQSEIVSYDALPAVDRQNLAGKGFETVSEGDLGYSFPLLYTEDERTESALVPDPAHPVIEWESGHRGRVSIEHSERLQEKTYRYTATQRGTLQEAGKRLRRTHLIELSNLSEEQHDIINEAIQTEGGYEVVLKEETTVSETTSDLFAQFVNEGEKALNYIEREDRLLRYAQFLVKYNGTIYWADVEIPSAMREDA